MRILCVTHYFPLPLDMGGAIRVHGLVRGLAERHSVHLLVLRRPDTPDALVAGAGAELGAFVEALPPVAQSSPGGLGAVPLWARSLAARTPPWVLDAFDPRIARRLAELAGEADVAVILDDYAGIYADTLRRAAPRLPIVADKPRVIGAALDGEAPPHGPRERITRSLGVRLSRAFESRYVARVDATVVTSPEEAERYRALYGREPDSTIVSAVDLPAKAGDPDGPRAIGWIGALDGRPVREGLVRFVEEAWEPLGREGYELRVAGRNAPPGVSALERFPGVRLEGYVEDAHAFVGRLAAAVIPLWGGQGLKLKTLTLLGAGLPVAATPVALEGIPAEHGHHCMIGRDPADLAAALRTIAADPELAARLRRESRSFVAERFTWDAVAERFVEVVERAAREGEAMTVAEAV